MGALQQSCEFQLDVFLCTNFHTETWWLIKFTRNLIKSIKNKKNCTKTTFLHHQFFLIKLRKCHNYMYTETNKLIPKTVYEENNCLFLNVISVNNKNMSDVNIKPITRVMQSCAIILCIICCTCVRLIPVKHRITSTFTF